MSHSPARMLPMVKIQIPWWPKLLSIVSPVFSASRVCALTCFVRKKGAEGGDGQTRREGEGAEDDEGRWAMMQPIDNSDEDDLLHLCSRLDGDFKRRSWYVGRLGLQTWMAPIAWKTVYKGSHILSVSVSTMIGSGEILSKEEREKVITQMINSFQSLENALCFYTIIIRPYICLSAARQMYKDWSDEKCDISKPRTCN